MFNFLPILFFTIMAVLSIPGSLMAADETEVYENILEKIDDLVCSSGSAFPGSQKPQRRECDRAQEPHQKEPEARRAGWDHHRRRLADAARAHLTFGTLRIELALDADVAILITEG